MRKVDEGRVEKGRAEKGRAEKGRVRRGGKEREGEEDWEGREGIKRGWSRAELSLATSQTVRIFFKLLFF